MPAAKFGMWLFLASEALLFTGFFVAYFLYYGWYSSLFIEAAKTLDPHLGFLNTAILLTSSWLMAKAVTSEATLKLLSGVQFLGLTFLGIKFYEYYEHYSKGELPGFINFKEMMPEGKQIFFNLYTVGTGLHALHMVAGLSIIGIYIFMILFKKSPSEESIVRIGLYWHFVDIVWLYLYPSLYLIGGISWK